MCGRPQTHTEIKQTHIFSVVHFPFSASRNFKLCCRPHTGITCESMEGGYHIRRAHTLVPKTEKDVELLQSAKTFEKAPILNIFEILQSSPKYMRRTLVLV